MGKIDLITSDDIVTYALTPEEAELVKHHANLCSLGGRSSVRGLDRQARLNEDQIFGQCCELGGWMAFFGRWEGLEKYNQSRERRNKDPWASDNGNDIEIEGLVDTLIDVKGSNMRWGSNPLKYNLVYPLKEHNDNTLYILGLSILEIDTYYVNIVGWIMGYEMPAPTDFKGYGNRRWLGAENLQPISELQL